MRKNLIIIFLNILLISLISLYPVFSANPPNLPDFVDSFGRILNVAVAVGGLVLVIMIAYGVWKSSMALGDPRGLEGAKQTWSYAIFGFFIVVGVYTLFIIISGIFGISSLSPGGLINNVKSAIEEFTGIPRTHRAN